MPDDTVHILVVGHSWCVDMFDNKSGYKQELEAELSQKLGKKVEIDVIAEKGKDIAWAKGKLQQMEKSGQLSKYSAVILFNGLNDSAKDEGVIAKRFRDLYAIASGNGAREVFVFNIAPYAKNEEWIERFNERIATMTPKDYLVDVFSLMVGLSEERNDKRYLTDMHPPDYVPVRQLLTDKLCWWVEQRRMLSGLVPELKNQDEKTQQKEKLPAF